MVASAVFELCRVLNRHHTTYSDQMIRWTEGQAPPNAGTVFLRAQSSSADAGVFLGEWRTVRINYKLLQDFAGSIGLGCLHPERAGTL